MSRKGPSAKRKAFFGSMLPLSTPCSCSLLFTCRRPQRWTNEAALANLKLRALIGRKYAALFIALQNSSLEVQVSGAINPLLVNSPITLRLIHLVGLAP